MQVWLINGEPAFPDQKDSFCIVIDTENMMADGGKAAASDQAHVAATNDANLQESLSGEAPHCMTIWTASFGGSRAEEACEFMQFRALERPFGPKKH